MDQAVKVTPSIEIDWSALGRVFADQKSDDQAAFILGFFERVENLQLAFIGSDAQFDTHASLRLEVSDVLDNLAYQIRGGEKPAPGKPTPEQVTAGARIIHGNFVDRPGEPSYAELLWAEGTLRRALEEMRITRA